MSDEFEQPEEIENLLDDNTSMDENNESSAIDDPSIQASLKQLSMAESANCSVVKHTPESVKNIVEAAILASSKAINLDKLLSLFPEGENIDKNILRQAIELLMQDYELRGIELVEVSSGFRFQVTQNVAPWVARLWEEKPQKYSRALLETLALVAYRQPITRGEIEEIRGVSVSSQIMRTLVDREWVRVIGHRDVPGKPAMYATTKQFLDYFGLKKLDELPTLSEIRDLDTINAELDFGDADTATQDDEEHEKPDQTELGIDEQSTDSLETDSFEKESSETESSQLDERIDVEVELAALRETYEKMDTIASVDEIEEKIGIHVPEKTESEHEHDLMDNESTETEPTENDNSEKNRSDETHNPCLCRQRRNFLL